MSVIGKIESVKCNSSFKNKYSYVLGVRYGTHGVIPTNNELKHCACLSSSGDSACGGYGGEERIGNTDLFIVTCRNGMECMKYNRGEE